MSTDFHVYIERIDEISPHPNADKMEFAIIKGWRCLVPKNEFVVGENVIFVQPDSILPKEFMDKFEIKYLKHGGRVGVVKLRGEYSQGLVLKNADNHKKGEDVAGYYGIKKWEPEVKGDPLMRKSDKTSRKKQHKDFLKYTDVERAQNHPDVIDPEEWVYATEKIHGMNFRAGWVKAHPKPKHVQLWRRFLSVIGKSKEEWKWDFTFGSHNVENPDMKVFKMITEREDLKNKIPWGFVVYGEIYGPGIQPGFHYCVSEPSVAFFDISKEDGKFIDFGYTLELLEAWLLPNVPVLWVGRYADFDPKLIDGESVLAQMNDMHDENDPRPHIREGVVIHLLKEKWADGLGRVILKFISNAYLEKKTEGTIKEVADDPELEITDGEDIST
jgi:RNA ligase (TIGR02306 family)